jgi:hypothetical protein
VTIKPATLRDVSFIAANLRQQDRREIMATVAVHNVWAAVIGLAASDTSQAWCAWLDGQPVGIAGFSVPIPLQPHIGQAWAFGSERFRRVVPALTRFVVAEWPALLADIGVSRLEMRSLADHDIAHRWLSGMGVRREAIMPGYGVNGETFELWAITKNEVDHVLCTTEGA